MPENDRSWNLKMVRAREALALLPTVVGDDDRVDWGDVWVGHLDTGYTRNPVFGWENGRSDWLLADRGVNYIEPNTDPFDPLDYRGFPGHGTRTSSILTGNLPGKFVGVAPSVPTIPYRVTNTVILASKAIRQNLANAIRHAVDHNACDVISISLGINVLSWIGGRPLGRAVDYAYDNGVIVVAAGGQVIDRVTYPGKFFRTIGVGGVRSDRHIWFEYADGYQEFIDVWAPADDVLRANTTNDGDGPRYSYDETGDGTSFATVHVAGAAAMWLVKRNEEIDKKYKEPWQRVEAFRDLVKSTSSEVKGDYRPAKNTGILNIEKLIKAKLPDPASKKRPIAEGQFM